MVFESVVADVLNRFLGDYVENLNRSQLKIGIWGGDVVLENLVLKQNALDDLDLPVQTVFGHLGKLVLKIPWKNLYGASVEATVERLFLLVAPNQEVQYDSEKEERLQLQNKQSELQRVEEAKKREQMKGEQPVVDNSFVEKLVTQIIKNVQLNIKDIHIRYEDKVTNPKVPFSLGISLHNLSVNTTDETWRRCVLQEAVTKIYKILDLEGLALYWNPDTVLYTKYTREEMLKTFESEIATKQDKPATFKYILGPINASAKLKLNPKPEQDTPQFEIPKVILNLDMDQLAIGITKAQYQDVMMLADSMDRMTKGMPYRKYRPFLNTYQGHYKEWWKFAYTCILEQEVKRRRRNWDWNHICLHRDTCRRYAAVYQIKLQTPPNKLPSDQVALINSCEKTLDLFNLVVIRQRIEMEVARLGKLQEEANKNKGWFSGWWGGGSTKDQELSESTDIMKQFQKAMTPDEKSKLFQAIDYQENSAPMHFPIEFVATECHFVLGCLLLHVTDDHVDVLKARLNHVQVSLVQRPSANALGVIVRMQEFAVSGLDQNGMTPQLVTSKQIQAGVSLLDVAFDTNPLDGNCGQRLKVAARPLQMVYDAETIIKVVEVFKPPSESSALSQLQAAANNRLSNLKEKSALGLEYAVKQHEVVDIDIDICSSYIILPHSGIFKKDESCLVVNLGAISMKSAPRSEKALNIHQLVKEGADDEKIFMEASKCAYDKFELKLTEIQVVIAMKGEDWLPSITNNEVTPLHLLQPTTLSIAVDKCLITDDPRLPKIKVSGHLAQIAINASEDRLFTLVEVLLSIPFPKDEQPMGLKPAESRSSSLSLLKYFDPSENKKRQNEKKEQRRMEEDFVQLTEVEADFNMDELILTVIRKQTANTSEPSRLVSMALSGLQLKAVQRTLTLEASVQLGGLEATLHRGAQGDVTLVRTEKPEDDVRRYLFTLKYVNVQKKCPEFHSRYGSVEQLIELDFTILQLILHQEGIRMLLTVASQYQSKLDDMLADKDRVGTAGTPLSTIMEDEELPSLSKPVKTVSKKRTQLQQVEAIGLKVNVFMKQVGVEIATDARSIAKMEVTGLRVGVIMKNSYMQVNATLQDIQVIYLNPTAVHKKIISIVGGDALTVALVLYNMEHYGNEGKNDITVDAQISCVRIVFLNWFVTSMLNFLNNFQTAQQAIKDASVAAAETAKVNVQHAQEQATKIALDIRLNAPIVIVPENSRSYKAVMVDFGQITMTNKFIEIQVKGKDIAVVDELTLALKNLKMSRVKLSKTNDNIYEKMLLQPLTFNLIVKRNLSSWYNQIPDIDMSGRLKGIHIKIANSDFKMMMKVLSENLTEGQDQPSSPPPTTQRPTLKSSVSLESKYSTLKKTDMAMHQAKKKEPVSPSAPKTLIKFTFTMDSLTIEMMNKSSDTSKTLSPPGPSDEVGLARFSLLLLSVKGRMLSDQSMYTSLLLVDCLLDDTRPHRSAKITRFMQRRQDINDEVLPSISQGVMQDTEKLRSMIDITFTQKQADIFLDVRVFSFNLILSMDFLMKISDFVMGGLAVMNPEPTKPEVVPVDVPEGTLVRPDTLPKISRKVSKISGPDTDRKLESLKAQPTTEKKGMVTINLKVEKPDIILVESMDDKECQALVLNNEITFKMRMTDTEQVMNGSIQELHLFTCLYGSNGPKEIGRYTVLVPCDLSLNASANANHGWHVDIALTDIRLNVSPATINLLNRVLVTMTKSGDDIESKPDVIGVYKDLWEVKPFQEQTFWFLRPDVAEDTLETYAEETETKSAAPVVLGEICMLSAPVIIVSVETGMGADTIPMLNMQASLQGHIKDWSGQLSLETTWAMQVSYYNSSLALWEPLIEPVEVLKDNVYEYHPWELKLEVQMNKTPSGQDGSQSVTTPLSPGSDAPMAIGTDGVDGEVNLPQPNLAVQISSDKTLELTVTYTALQVLSQLGQAFSTAVKEGQSMSVSQHLSPYLLKNDTGFPVTLLLDKDAFIVYTKSSEKLSILDLDDISDKNDVLVEHGKSMPLQLRPGLIGSSFLNQKLPKWSLHIKILNHELCLPVVRADKRYFPLKRSSERDSVDSPQATGVPSESYGIISEIVMVEGVIQIHLRSTIQVNNQLTVAVEVHYMTSAGNQIESLGEVGPGASMNLPLSAVQSPFGELFFSVYGYLSVKPFRWKELLSNVRATHLLSCGSRNANAKDRFYIKAVGVMEQVFLRDTSRHTMSSACFNIWLRPAVVLQNTLPVEILVSPQGINKPEEHLVKPGATLHLPQVEPGNTLIVVMLPSYLEKCWVCTREMPVDADEFSVWTFESHDSAMKMVLDLGMHCSEVNGSQHFSLYCPFWMLNKTGLNIAYRKSRKNERRDSTDSPRKSSDESSNVLYHPADYRGPILFSFRAKNFFGKKKASIRVENGDWSSKFSLDVPGSSGVVSCKHAGKNYEIGVSNTLTYNSLTKQLTFTPYFLIINNAPFAIDCQEVDRPGDPFIRVEAKSSKALWPRSEKEDKLMRLKAYDHLAVSAPFIYTDQHASLLKLHNQYGGINVETQVSEGATYVTFGQYQPGLAPALIINHTDHNINLWEKESVNIKCIKSMHSAMYTWENPAGPRIIIFEGQKKKEVENDLRMDGLGEFSVGPNDRAFWVSFLDGMQRVLLLTKDLLLAHSAHTSGEVGAIATEATLSMHGLGLSLVNNITRQEILYMSIASSGKLWEQAKHGSKRFKSLSMNETAMLEEAYQRFQAECEVAKRIVSGRAQIDPKTEVDFETMEMLRPHKRKLRRILEPGVWAQWGSGTHRTQLHARLHRLQVDQQLPEPTFPVALAPVPPPKSVASSQAMKPFVELCIVERIMEHTSVKQYKYFKILVQEFHVKIDMGLINALVAMFPEEEISESVAAERFALDMESAEKPLECVLAAGDASNLKHFYDQLHLSPLKVHVSFSMGGATNLPSFLGTVLQGIGVTLTDMNDVIFKLAYYERKYEFLSQKELVSNATSHYTGQAIKQLYVLVLGLDVIGNPYGLVVGLTKGVEDLFYEPFQGAIQGPGEFAEGLILGVRSLLGHTLGGAAGAVSRITGAMGSGLAALSCDSDYQRKRRDNLNKPPANLQEGIARSGKGLLMGVVDGVTGVFTKPISGAREDGARGFFKGLGKGAVGLVARPTAGVVDFASGSFDAVKRAADMSSEVVKIRPTRWLEADGLVRPYSRHSAEGYKMLREIEKGKYIATDLYVTHLWVVGLKEAVLLSDKRIAYLEKNTVFGGWQIVWSYTWTELPGPPVVVEKGVFVTSPEARRKGLFGSSATGKLILLHDDQQKRHLVDTALSIMKDAR